MATSTTILWRMVVVVVVVGIMVAGWLVGWVVAGWLLVGRESREYRSRGQRREHERQKREFWWFFRCRPGKSEKRLPSLGTTLQGPETETETETEIAEDEMHWFPGEGTDYPGMVRCYGRRNSLC